MVNIKLDSFHNMVQRGVVMMRFRNKMKLFPSLSQQKEIPLTDKTMNKQMVSKCL